MKFAYSLKKLGAVSTSAIYAVKGINGTVNALTKRCDANNRLMRVADYGFVRAFDFTAQQICYCRISDYTETYISLVDEAIEMLSAGYNQADVLDYFEKVLMKEKVG